MTRTPAPFKPAAWMIRSIRGRRRRAAEDRREDERLARIERRLAPALTVEPTDTPVGPDRASLRVRSWMWRHRRDVGGPVGVAVALTVIWGAAHTIGGVVWLAALAPTVTGVWWILRIDRRGAHPAYRPVAGLAVLTAQLWIIPPLRFTPVGGVVPEAVSGAMLLGSAAAAYAVRKRAAWLGAGATIVAGMLVGGVHVSGPSGLPDFPVATVHGFPLPLRWVSLIVATTIAAAVRFDRFKPREVEPDALTEPGPADVWAEHIGCDGGALPGTWLGVKLPGDDEPRVGVDPHGPMSWRATVMCVRGKQGTGKVEAARDAIAGIYGIDPGWIEVQATGDHARPTIVVTEQATLAESRPWTPPGVTATTIEIATYPDGTRALCEYRGRGSGVRHWWFNGGTGSGKTTAVNGALGRLMLNGETVLDLVDLGETSLPAWEEKAFRHGTTPDDAALALRRGVAVLHARQKWQKEAVWTDRNGVERKGISTLETSREHPMYLVPVEEATKLLPHTEAMEDAVTISVLGRKYGVALMWITQPHDIKFAFGGYSVIREQIQAGGQVLAFLATSGDSIMAFGGGMKVNLGAIPRDKKGTGFIQSPVMSRTAMCRVDWIDDDDSRPKDVPSSFEVAEHAVPGELEDFVLTAIEGVEAKWRVGREAATVGGATPAGQVDESFLEQRLTAQIVHDLAADSPTGTVRLGDVAAGVAVRREIQADSDDWRKLYDRIRKTYLPRVATQGARGLWEEKAS